MTRNQNLGQLHRIHIRETNKQTNKYVNYGRAELLHTTRDTTKNKTECLPLEANK